MDLNCAQCPSIFVIQTFKNFHKAVQSAATCRRELLHWQSIITTSSSHHDCICKSDNQSWRQRLLKTVNSDETVNLTEMTKSGEDNQLQISQRTWQSCDFGTFLLLQVLLMQLSGSSCEALLLLFICLFTHSQESAVLFLLLLCVVLVLYSYQESTLLWRPWIPLIIIKLGVINIKPGVFVWCF